MTRSPLARCWNPARKWPRLLTRPTRNRSAAPALGALAHSHRRARGQRVGVAGEIEADEGEVIGREDLLACGADDDAHLRTAIAVCRDGEQCRRAERDAAIGLPCRASR